MSLLQAFDEAIYLSEVCSGLGGQGLCFLDQQRYEDALQATTKPCI